MDERQLLATIWNWLPAFRAVADTEHLPTASKRLHLTPSALSRSIRQLEDAIGHELFNRVGRQITLNTRGARLLLAVSESTQSLESALASITTDAMQGPIRVATLGVLTDDYVLPAILELKQSYPAIEPILLNHGQKDANDLLVRGRVDVVFNYDPFDHDDLVMTKIGACTLGVYCGRGHELFAVPHPSLETLLEHRFSVAVTGDRGRPIDGWPIDVPRKIGMKATMLSSAIVICRSGLMLSVLPDVVAIPLLEQGLLRRFDFDFIPPSEMFVSVHKKNQDNPAIDALIEAVEDRVAAVDRMVAALSAPVRSLA